MTKADPKAVEARRNDGAHIDQKALHAAKQRVLQQAAKFRREHGLR